MSKGKFALGALVGAAAGVVAGILTAPKSGKETREDLKRKAEDIKSETSEKVEEVKEKSSAKAQEAKHRANDLRDRTERAVDAGRKEFHKDKK